MNTSFRTVAAGLLFLLLPCNGFAAPDAVKPNLHLPHPKHASQPIPADASEEAAAALLAVFNLAPETDGAPLIDEAARVPSAPDASALSLLDEGRIVVYPNFVSICRFHQIVKILDQSAAKTYSEFPLSRTTSTSEALVERARIITADGTAQDVTKNPQHEFIEGLRSTLSLPSLAPGDLLDVSYLTADYHPSRLARQFWCGWDFNSLTESRLSRFVLITPRGLTYSTRSHGAIPDPTEHTSGKWRIREWRMTDIPAVQPEVLGLRETEAVTWLDVSTVPSWAAMARWYFALSAPRCVPNAAVRAKAAALTAASRTEDEKIQVLGEFVAHEIKYDDRAFRLTDYVPVEGREVLRRSYGDSKDKAALFSALLAAVGIKSEMVLLNGRSQGLVTYLPSPRFGDVINQVETAHGPLFVDTTADLLKIGNLPCEDQQVSALVISPATVDLTETPSLPIQGDSTEAAYTGDLSADGGLRGTYEAIFTGREAWDARKGLLEAPEARREESQRDFANFLVKGAVCDNTHLEHLHEPSLPLLLHFTYHSDNYASSAGSYLLMPLPWNGTGLKKLTADLAAEPKRMHDLEATNWRFRTYRTAKIHLPAGYLPQDLPPDVHQETAYGSFRANYKREGDLLTATFDSELSALRVLAADIPGYVAFLKARDSEISRQIVLKKL